MFTYYKTLKYFFFKCVCLTNLNFHVICDPKIPFKDI